VKALLAATGTIFSYPAAMDRGIGGGFSKTDNARPKDKKTDNGARLINQRLGRVN